MYEVLYKAITWQIRDSHFFLWVLDFLRGRVIKSYFVFGSSETNKYEAKYVYIYLL